MTYNTVTKARLQAVTLSQVHTGDKVEFNTVDFVESRLLPKSATNRQQSRLLPIRSISLPIRSTLLPVCTGPKQHGRFCRLSRKSSVLNSTLSPMCTGLYSEDAGRI